MVPLIVPSVLIDVPLPIDQTPSQQGADLEYIRALAAIKELCGKLGDGVKEAA